MRHLWGINDQLWHASRKPELVMLDTEAVINPHMLIAGQSGTGKSYQMMRVLESAAREGIHTEVFDVHEELHGVSGAVACKFSEATKLGYNPLVPSLDPHSGGVNRQIDAVIGLINDAGRKLGDRQRWALESLLADVYRLRGMDPDNPSSWSKRLITEAEFDQITAERNYSELRQCQPILRDVISYGERKLKALRTNADAKALSALEKVERTSRRIDVVLGKFKAASNDTEVERLQRQLEEEKADAISVYADFINSITHGRELQDAIKYTNPETLISVLERLQRLQRGVFRSNPPDSRGACTRVHQIGALDDEARSVLVNLRLEANLRECMNLGITNRVRRMVMIDEGHLYYSEDRDSPINRIAKEGRKYGLSLVIGSQSPSHFSEDFLTNCGTVLLTGIHERFWTDASKKLRVDMEVLRSTRAREVAALKMQGLGEASAKFINVNVNAQILAQARDVLRRASPMPA